MGPIKADAKGEIEANDIGGQVSRDLIDRLRDVGVSTFKGAHEGDDRLVLDGLGALLGDLHATVGEEDLAVWRA